MAGTTDLDLFLTLYPVPCAILCSFLPLLLCSLQRLVLGALRGRAARERLDDERRDGRARRAHDRRRPS